MEKDFPQVATLDYKVTLDLLEDDTPLRNLADGEKLLLVIATVKVASHSTYYKLYVQKATAQPLYQIHVEG